MKCTIDVQALLGPKSGVGYYISGLLSGLSKIENTHQYILSYFDFKRKGLPPDIEHNRFVQKRVCIPGRLPGFFWKYFNFPPYNLFFGSSDLYHFTNFIMRPVSCGKKIVSIFDASFLRFPQYTEPKNLIYLKRNIAKSIERADRIMTISEFSKSELEFYFPKSKNKIDVVHLGVEKMRFKMSSVISLRLPKKYILYVGNIEPRKNLGRLMQSFKKGDFKDYHLVLVGQKAWLYDEILRRSEDPQIKDRIILLGYVTDDALGEIYSRAQFFIYPSLYEGFGLPPLEAMSLGVPVLAARCSSLPEVLGEGALWFDPYSEEDMIEKMMMMSQRDDLKEEYKKRGVKVVEQYSWEKTAKETIECYEKTLGDKRHEL